MGQGAPQMAARGAQRRRWRSGMTADQAADARIFAPDFKEAPYWWEAAAPPPATAPELPERVDVAVVGGGYCGLNAALELARRGATGRSSRPTASASARARAMAGWCRAGSSLLR